MNTNMLEWAYAETEGREIAERLRWALQAANQGWWDWELAHDDLFLDRSCKTLLGVPPDSPLDHQSFLDRPLPEDRRRLERVMNDARERCGDFEVEFRAVWQDQSVHWVALRGRSFPDAQHQPIRLAGTLSEVTARKESQIDRERILRRQSHLLHASLRVVGETHLHGLLTTVADAARALTGARLASAGHGYVNGWFLVGAASRAADVAPCPAGEKFRIERGGVFMELVEGRNSIRLSDDDLRAHPRFCGAPPGHPPLRGLLGVRLVDRHDATNGMILVTDKADGDFDEEDEAFLKQLGAIASLALQHVEARTRVEEQAQSLRQSEDRLRLAITATRALVYEIDLVQGLVRVALGVEELLGYRPEEMPRSRAWWVAQIHPEAHATMEQADEQFRHVDRYCVEYRMRHKDGHYVYVADQGQILRDASGTAVREVGLLADITGQKRFEAELQAAKAAADAANQAKSEFLAKMSHEIRTPMTAILGYTDLLMQQQASEQERLEFLTIVRRNGEALLQLINDILDLSKIEAGKVEVERRRCSPREVVEEVMAAMRLPAEEKYLALDAEYVEPLPAHIETDPVRLRQILFNLVGNAVKFTAQGSVRVRVFCTRGERPQMQFTVRDTGIGIDAAAIPTLFQPFSQADSSFSRRFGGTGLGLAISQRLAHMLGGRIQVHSAAGRGSTFTLSIDPGPVEISLSPVAPRGEAALSASTSLETLQGRVLLVDDVPDTRMLLELVLQTIGLTVDAAADAPTALTLAARSQAEDRPYDLIFMDIQMPGIDGYEATRRLRQSGWQRPIVALTAHAMEGERHHCLEAGCSEYLPKPVRQAQLLDVLRRYLAPQAS